MSKTQIHVRVNNNFKQRVLLAANKQNLSLTAFVIAALNDRLETVLGKGETYERSSNKQE